MINFPLALLLFSDKVHIPKPSYKSIIFHRLNTTFNSE